MGQHDVKDKPSATPMDWQKTAPDEAGRPTTAAQDDPASRVSLPTEIEELRRKLGESEEAARANYDRFLRERADVENFKKRMQREKAEAIRFACEPLIRELLPVIDNLERAAAHANGNGQSVREGIEMVVKSLLEILDRHGVKRIEAVGQPFDPNWHQAMAQVESAEHEPNRVIEQHHSGYVLHDRLLRPALVTVSAPKSGNAVEREPNSD
jgi:molecular chaperone GrpE